VHRYKDPRSNFSRELERLYGIQVSNNPLLFAPSIATVNRQKGDIDIERAEKVNQGRVKDSVASVIDGNVAELEDIADKPRATTRGPPPICISVRHRDPMPGGRR
jgi:hypothetical protein